MKYVHENEDGTIALWSVVPTKITRVSDGAEFFINQTRTVGQGPNARFEIGGGNDIEAFFMDVGPAGFDVGDLEADSLGSNYVIHFPTFEEAVLDKLHPDNKVKVKKHKKIKSGDLPADRTFRGAWRLKANGKIDVDVGAARTITRQHLTVAANMAKANLEREYTQMQMQGGNAAALTKLRDKHQKWSTAKDDPRIDAATTVDELKAVLDEVSAS